MQGDGKEDQLRNQLREIKNKLAQMSRQRALNARRGIAAMDVDEKKPKVKVNKGRLQRRAQ